MITTYSHEPGGRLVKRDGIGGVPKDIVWFDLYNPTEDEEKALEQLLAIDIPTKGEMHRIEVSSRLYSENGAVFMIGSLPARSESDEPEVGPVTFVLTADVLVTVRYHEPRAFITFPARAETTPVGCSDGATVFVGLMEAVVDRLADLLEQLSRDVEAGSHNIFRRAERKRLRGRTFQDVLIMTGRKGEAISRFRDSLLTIERMVGFLLRTGLARKRDDDFLLRLKTLAKDARALSDHAVFLSQKINFLLDATLGMVNIEQNTIIKIFSIAAVTFLPPTLIASIYGMNFKVIPELQWDYGYPIAIFMMVLSAALSLWYFKRNNWL